MSQKTLDTWLQEYGVSHQNPINKKIHWLCVPVIYFSIVGMLYQAHVWLAIAMLAFTSLFYFRLSTKLFMGMGVFALLCLALISAMPQNVWIFLAVFVVAWIGQFIGHHIEGAKPSFFEDLQFLLIGPAWCMDALFKKFAPNWRNQLS